MPASRKNQVRVVRLPSRGQVTLPREFRQQLGLEEGDLIQMRLVEGRIEITPLAPEQHQRLYTDAEISQFLEDDMIDEETAVAVRRMLAERAL
ncbi:MAG: AbrB/MazE/SpoVT family DNA-binding domain-containing protein [Anaerolineae bacterium]